jgi:lysine 2,3-aminomutase
LRGHTTGLAQPMYVWATKIGKIPLMRDYYTIEETDSNCVFRNHRGELITLPNVPE